MCVLGLALLALLIVGIVLEHLGAGIVVLTVVLVIAVVGWALGGLFLGRSRRRTAMAGRR